MFSISTTRQKKESGETTQLTEWRNTEGNLKD